MSERDENPCMKLLARLEHDEHEEEMRDAVELIALFVLVTVVIACYVLSIAIDVTEAIVSAPPAVVLAYHKRHRMMALAAKLRHKDEIREMISDAPASRPE